MSYVRFLTPLNGTASHMLRLRERYHHLTACQMLPFLLVISRHVSRLSLFFAFKNISNVTKCYNFVTFLQALQNAVVTFPTKTCLDALASRRRDISISRTRE